MWPNKYLTLTQTSVSTLENVHISLINTDETVLNCTEMLSGLVWKNCFVHIYYDVMVCSYTFYEHLSYRVMDYFPTEVKEKS